MAQIKQGIITEFGKIIPEQDNNETISSLGITVSDPLISKYVSFQIGTNIDNKLTYGNSMHLGRSGIYEIDNLDEGIKFKVTAIDPNNSNTQDGTINGTIYIDYVVN